MENKKMTNEEILHVIRSATKKAWVRSTCDIMTFGSSSEIASRSVSNWIALDDVCCELGIEY